MWFNPQQNTSCRLHPRSGLNLGRRLKPPKGFSFPYVQKSKCIWILSLGMSGESRRKLWVTSHAAAERLWITGGGTSVMSCGEDEGTHTHQQSGTWSGFKTTISIFFCTLSDCFLNSEDCDWWLWRFEHSKRHLFLMFYYTFNVALWA